MKKYLLWIPFTISAIAIIFKILGIIPAEKLFTLGLLLTALGLFMFMGLIFNKYRTCSFEASRTDLLVGLSSLTSIIAAGFCLFL